MNLSPNESKSLRVLAIRGEVLEPIPEGPVAWASSDPNVATVDAMGTVRGVAPGRAKIRVEWTAPGQPAPFADTLDVVVAAEVAGVRIIQ